MVPYSLPSLTAAPVGQPAPYSWLPLAAQAVVIKIMSACILRPGGKTRHALQCVSAGQQLVADRLAAMGIGGDCREADLSARAVWEGR